MRSPECQPSNATPAMSAHLLDAARLPFPAPVRPTDADAEGTSRAMIDDRELLSIAVFRLRELTKHVQVLVPLARSPQLRARLASLGQWGADQAELAARLAAVAEDPPRPPLPAVRAIAAALDRAGGAAARRRNARAIAPTV